MNNLWDSDKLFQYGTVSIDVISLLDHNAIAEGAFVRPGIGKYNGLILAGIMGSPKDDIINGYTVGIIYHEVDHANNYLHGIKMNRIDSEWQATILQYNYWQRVGTKISGTFNKAMEFLKTNSTNQKKYIEDMYGN